MLIKNKNVVWSDMNLDVKTMTQVNERIDDLEK